MPDLPFAPAPAQPEITAEDRHQIIVEAGLDYMTQRDWYWVEDDDDPDVVAQLERLYADDLQPTPCSGSDLFDTGVTLALRWWVERRAEWERSLPVWSCDCGAVYKREPWSARHEAIYTLTPDGQFDELIGSTTGKRGIGPIPRDTYAMSNGGCPACGRAFRVTIARQADPQTSLILLGA